MTKHLTIDDLIWAEMMHSLDMPLIEIAEQINCSTLQIAALFGFNTVLPIFPKRVIYSKPKPEFQLLERMCA